MVTSSTGWIVISSEPSFFFCSNFCCCWSSELCSGHTAYPVVTTAHSFVWKFVYTSVSPVSITHDIWPAARHTHFSHVNVPSLQNPSCPFDQIRALVLHELTITARLSRAQRDQECARHEYQPKHVEKETSLWKRILALRVQVARPHLILRMMLQKLQTRCPKLRAAHVPGKVMVWNENNAFHSLNNTEIPVPPVHTVAG